VCAARTILTINAGSSSLRLAAFSDEGALKPVASERVEPANDEHPFRAFLERHEIHNVVCVAHRVVHGGDFTDSALIDARVESEIGRLAPFAPLHNPFALHGIRACRSLLGTAISQVAVFDTSFFTRLPELARTYAIPFQLARENGLRRYGFHGIAHRSMWHRWHELAQRPATSRVILLQLGAGCSIAAVKDGGAVDTSMGFSPLEGLVMATRSGDLDPGLAIYLQREKGMSADELDDLLNRHSGLLGISGKTSDMRELLESDDPKAKLAIDVYCYRARKYVGAYLAVLGGVDAVLFGGGVGENASHIRDAILRGMEWAGIELDARLNREAGAGTPTRISGPQSPAAVWVMPVDEALILAQEARRLGGIKHA
jgi:acetate kinase